PRRVHQRARHRGGAAARGPQSHAGRAAAVAGVAQELRPRHRGAAELQPRAAPGSGQRLFHPGRGRALGSHRRLVVGRAGMKASRGSGMKTLRPRFGLLAKIILFLAAVLIPLAAVTWLISVHTLKRSMTEEFTSKGTAIANSLASSGVDLILTRDASTVQALIDQFAAISGVADVMVYDANRAQIARTFVPFVPPDVVDKNVVPGDLAKQVRDIEYADPVTGKSRRIIDIGVPMLGGTLGTV